jgi:uncharacterized phage infection (PIP) family protein YhgE
MQLVGEHVEKSRYVRDRLQLLTFNSIVEASHLGSKADAILEISQSIKRIAVAWSEMTDRSAQAMEEILTLVERAGKEMQAFSAAGSEELKTAQIETRQGLDSLRSSAALANSNVTEIEAGLKKLQARISAVSASRDQLQGSFSVTESARTEMEKLARQMEIDHPEARQQWSRSDAEAIFGDCYTTEVEREVLRAALRGAPLPEAQHNLEGNSVELF